ncbi:MAG TPA: hypothetical protein VF113_04685 [Stellaceae bacterium]
MRWYRIYLYGTSRSLLGRHEFEANDDRAAMAAAEQLWDACADVAASFELWDGVRRVDTEFSKMPCPTVSAEQVMMAAQVSLVKHEEAMRRSFWALASSERLLQRIRELGSSPVAKNSASDAPNSPRLGIT